MRRIPVAAACFLAATLLPQRAQAVSSAELYSATAYSYGRVEARVRFAAGDGVISSFFLWKDGSETPGTFWNELDDEKVGADCRLESNAIYGKPSVNHSQRQALDLDLCGAFHTYAYEWTPEAIVWRIDGQDIRHESGVTAQAFAANAAQPGMQIHLNLWPGDASFGGSFNPAILPVHEYVDWVAFSAYENGEFKLAWREEFEGSTLPANWLTGTWASSKNLSTHASENVNFIDGYAVLSLTADDARGPAGAMPGDTASGGSSNHGGAAGGASSNTGGATDGSSSGIATGSMASAGAGGTPTSGIGACSFGLSSSDRSCGLGLAAMMYVLVRRRASLTGRTAPHNRAA